MTDHTNVSLSLEKWHGAHNDFYFLQKDSLEETCLKPTWIPALCDRYSGLGADGVVLWYVDPSYLTLDHSSKSLKVFLRIWNADGSATLTCGNALRCLTALVLDFVAHRPEFQSLGQAAPKLEFLSYDPNSPVFQDKELRFRTVAWGLNSHALAPNLNGHQVDVLIDSQETTLVTARKVDAPLLPAGLPNDLQVAYVELANPHLVLLSQCHEWQNPDFVKIWGKWFQSQDGRDFVRPVLEMDTLPVSNISFLQWKKYGPQEAQTPIVYPLMVYERGAGFTQACGTGATACAMVLQNLHNLGTTPSPLSTFPFALPGGILKVYEKEEQMSLDSSKAYLKQWVLSGPACKIASLNVKL